MKRIVFRRGEATVSYGEQFYGNRIRIIANANLGHSGFDDLIAAIEDARDHYNSTHAGEAGVVGEAHDSP